MRTVNHYQVRYIFNPKFGITQHEIQEIQAKSPQVAKSKASKMYPNHKSHWLQDEDDENQWQSEDSESNTTIHLTRATRRN